VKGGSGKGSRTKRRRGEKKKTERGRNKNKSQKGLNMRDMNETVLSMDDRKARKNHFNTTGKGRREWVEPNTGGFLGMRRSLKKGGHV